MFNFTGHICPLYVFMSLQQSELYTKTAIGINNVAVKIDLRLIALRIRPGPDDGLCMLEGFRMRGLVTFSWQFLSNKPNGT